MEGPRQYVQVLTGPHFSRSQEVRVARLELAFVFDRSHAKGVSNFQKRSRVDRQGHRKSLFCNQYFKDWLEAG